MSRVGGVEVNLIRPRPRDVPTVRDALIAQPTALLDPWFARTVTPDIPLYFATPDVMAQAVEVAASMPDGLTIAEAAPPTTTGLVVFGHPVYGLDTDAARESICQTGLVWNAHTRFTESCTGCGIAALSVLSDVWLYCGRSDWLDSERLGEVGIRDLPRLSYITVPDSDRAKASFIEDRRLLSALWILMRTPKLVETREWPHNRSHRRRHGNAAVSVVDIRPRIEDGDPPEPQSDTGRRVSVRHWVRPFVRMQPYGPGRSLRRPQLIPGHVRGPEDGPLVERERVWRLA